MLKQLLSKFIKVATQNVFTITILINFMMFVNKLLEFLIVFDDFYDNCNK